MKLTKIENRRRIQMRVRKTIKGTAARPRLTVFRSNTSMYAQLIDDVSGRTLCHASTKDPSVGKANKSEQAKAAGLILAKKALALSIQSVVFDRSGYLYHGRVKALSDGAREGGLQF